MGRPKNGFLRQPSSRSKTFTTSLSQPQGCLESPQLALQPLWIDGKCKKWVLSPLGPRLHPCEHQRTPKRRAQGPPGAGPCRGDPKGPVWPPGATGTRARWLVMHRAVAGVRARPHTRPRSAGRSTMETIEICPRGFAVVWGVHRAARNPKGGPWAALAENFPVSAVK